MAKDKQTVKRHDRLAELESMTVSELKGLAADLELASTSGLRKPDLIERIAQAELASTVGANDQIQDRLLVQQISPFWINLQWEVSENLLNRAISALGKDWHLSEKILRVYRVQWDDSGPQAREHLRDEAIPEEADEWFIRLDDQANAWKFELGYLAAEGKFFSLLHSANIHAESTSQRQFNRSKSLLDDLHSPRQLDGELTLEVEGSVTLRGATVPGATVSVDDEPTEVDRKSGRFDWQSTLQGGRIVVPIVSEQGKQRLRAVVSIESNIHYLEPEKTSGDS